MRREDEIPRDLARGGGRDPLGFGLEELGRDHGGGESLAHRIVLRAKSSFRWHSLNMRLCFISTEAAAFVDFCRVKALEILHSTRQKSNMTA